MMFALQLSTLTETGQLQADVEVKTLTPRIIQPLCGRNNGLGIW